jgi:hypothetical protein
MMFCKDTGTIQYYWTVEIRHLFTILCIRNGMEIGCSEMLPESWKLRRSFQSGLLFGENTKKYQFTVCLKAELLYLRPQTVVVAQSVRALVCGSRGRGFDPHHPPVYFN